MTIKAVFFDMGGTIETFYYDAELRIKASEDLVCLLKEKDLDLALTPGQLYLHIGANLDRAQQAVKQTDEEISPECFWQDYVFCDHPFGREKINAAAEELSCWLETHYYLRRLRPEAPEALERLHLMGLKLGVISNIQSRTQVGQSLEKYGIRQYFDIIVTSSNYGVRKPHPSIFHYAASQMGVPTSACAHVGDRISRDIAGARRAGLGLAVQIVHDFNPDQDSGNHIPDARITRMTELIEVIQRVNQELTHQDMHSRTIKAILFDAGDVLYYRNNKGQQFKAYLESLGLSVEGKSNEYVKSLEHQGYVGKISQDEYRKKLLDHYGVYGNDQVARGMLALAADDNNVLVFEGVRETLIALKNEGYLLGIITDTANPLRAKLDWFERSGFGHVWDAIVSSIDIGVRKPAPAIYQAALRQLGIEPSQAVFVGHKASELNGAREVGMKTVAFNYELEAEADIYIEKFNELLQVPFIAPKNIWKQDFRLMGKSTQPLWWEAALSTMWAIKQFETLSDFFAAAGRIGFNQYELNHQVDSRMLADLDFDHLTITAVHEPCPADIPTPELKSRGWLLSATNEADRQQGVRYVLRSVDFARKVGARFVIVHLGTVSIKPQWEDNLRRLYNRHQIDSAQAVELQQRMAAERAEFAPAHLDAVHKSLSELVAYAAPLGVCLGIENRYHFADIPHPEEMEMLLQNYALDQVCFWYDSGHAQALDRLGFFRHETWLSRFAGRMKGMHLHDVCGVEDHFAPGLGEVDWEMVARYAPAGALRTLELKPENSPEAVVLGMQRLVETGIVQPMGLNQT